MDIFYSTKYKTAIEFWAHEVMFQIAKDNDQAMCFS